MTPLHATAAAGRRGGPTSPRRRLPDHGPGGGVGTALSTAVAIAATAAAVAAGAALLLRRGNGALAPPTGVAPLVAVVVAGGLLAGVTDVAARRSLPCRFLVRLGLAMAAAALAPSAVAGNGAGFAWRSPAGVVAGSFGLVATAILLSPLADRRRMRRSSRSPPRSTEPAAGPVPGSLTPSPPVPAPPPADPVAVPPASPARGASAGPAGILQQRFERVLIPEEGVERVECSVVVTLAAGARTGVAHVGFCPPFARIPHVEVGTSCEDVEATLVAAEVLPWGVRVECRLDEPADETIGIPVDVSARAPLDPGADDGPAPGR